MMAIKKFLEKNEVKFFENCNINDINITNNKITSIVDDKLNLFEAEEFVFTTGIYTSKIAKKFNLNLLMQAGKGFSFIKNKNEALNFSTPMILAEKKVAITPYENMVRFGGTMMLGDNDLSINKRRINNIRKAANSYINNLDIQEDEMLDQWAGLRPCSPDGIPYVGKSKEIKNLTIATGHAMMGVSLAPLTGQIVSDLISETNINEDIKKMSLYRFTK